MVKEEETDESSKGSEEPEVIESVEIEEKPEPEVMSSTQTAAPPAMAKQQSRRGDRSKSSKIAKSSNPDYTQVLFHLPIKLSKRLNGMVNDLELEGEAIDRSDLAEELLSILLSLKEKHGAAKALHLVRRLNK